MSEREMSRDFLRRQLESLLGESYRPLDPQHFAGEDARLAELLNRLGERMESRQSYERRLQDSRGRLEKILREAPIGICVTDEGGYFVEVNPAYCRLYGYRRQELIGRHFTLVVPEEHRGEMQELHDRFMGRSYELQGEWTVKHRDGSSLTVMARAAYLIDEQDSPKKVTFLVDMTERKRYEEELNRTVAALEREIEERTRLEETRERVERMVRHDLKNPLNGIMGAAQMLEEECVGGEQRELISMISDSGGRLLSMLEGMFDYMMMEEGRYELRPEPVELTSLLKTVRTGLKRLSDRRRVGVEITVDGEELDRASAVRVTAERKHLQTMLEHLLQNALEASPEGRRVTMSVRTGERICFDIHNAGTVPEEVRESFFRKYATAGKERGTGLGTYVSKLIAEQHGGSITFTSGEEEGTHLYLEFPSGTDGVRREE